ncbi:MAG: sugar ABC transporter permease [Bacilli bacterium]
MKEAVTHEKKTRLYFFKQPFRHLIPTYNSASNYRKFTMLLNFLLPGMGNVLVGAVEIGLVVFSVFVALLVGEINLIQAFVSKAISLSPVDATVVFALLNISLLALYFSSFKLNVSTNYKINNDLGRPRSIILAGLKTFGRNIRSFFVNLSYQFHVSERKEKIALVSSFFLMGIPLMCYKEFVKGILFLLVQVLITSFLIARGVADIENFFILSATESLNGVPLLYGIIALLLVVFFLVMYFLNYKSVVDTVTRINGRKEVETYRREIHNLANSKFYITSLIVPVLGTVAFTIIPLIFMVLIAFTNYSLVTAEGYNNTNANLNIFLDWVGLSTFERVFTEGANLQDLLSVFSWTMIWATIATFSCYFGGLFLAMLLNKKAIKGKIIYRSLFVVAMAMPQFVSLLTMRTIFDTYGPLNSLLVNLGIINQNYEFWMNEFSAKTLILFINMWVGIPYYMLLMSGLLINIPNDYYEAATIDGASKWQQFKRITFPNILYMTTPLLITSFVSNINNFNVIYFLTNGGTIANGISNTAFKTDIFITWLYTLTMKKYDYNFGAAIGIVMFILSATISLIVFRKSKAYSNEEEYR